MKLKGIWEGENKFFMLFVLLFLGTLGGFAVYVINNPGPVRKNINEAMDQLPIAATIYKTALGQHLEEVHLKDGTRCIVLNREAVTCEWKGK